MPDAFSEDEYDALPDPFVNIDWDAVERSNNNTQTGYPAPPPRTPPTTHQQGPVEQNSESSDEYDLLPDPFAGIVWDGDTPTNGVLAGDESRPSSSNTTHVLYRGQKRSLQTHGPVASSSKKSKREPFTPPQVNSALTSAGRGHSIDQDSDILSVLKSFEDDITCPICCDMLACAHLGNPCGHCYCGECGWNWISTKVSSNHL
ncbi:hypothetical protein QCA50_000085 [Cerrena zonata]|uniref:RING-type domain-containing protein n=1 Tax=Cerrena zonata TaxID=2478898 RepID=A0AAW0GVY3_9APHY